MQSILITGCNRGLGLGLVKALVNFENAPQKIIATCRKPAEAKDLQSIASQHKNVTILQYDATDFDSYSKFAKEVSNVVQEDGLNVLFNNAGVSGKFARLTYIKPHTLSDAFTVNTIAPTMLTKELHPLLKKASDLSQKPMGIGKAVVINMSSILASMAENNGGNFAYRASKAALNSITKTMSAEFKQDKIMVVSLHPGWVKTDMGGPKAPLSVEESTSTMIKTLWNLKEEHNGAFIDYTGKTLPW